MPGTSRSRTADTATRTGIVTIQLERRPPWVDLAEYEEDAWHDVDEEEQT